MAAHVTRSRRLRRSLAVAGLLGLAVAGLGACSASDGGRSWSGGDSSVSEQQAPGAPQSAPDTESGGGSKDSSTTSGSSGSAPVALLTGNRDLIRTGQLSVEVEDLAAAAARARAHVATQGGQISSENSVLTAAEGSGGSFVQMVIALPPEALDASMDSLAGLGELASRSQSVEDVTLQVVDLESRTASMRSSIERVRALMDRATSIADVVALEGELSRREADLESMTGQLQSLQTQAAVSTLVLTLSASPAPAAAQEDRDGVLGALMDSVDALGRGGSALLIGIAAALPFALLIGLVGGIGWLVARSRRRVATSVAASAPATAPATAPEPPTTERAGWAGRHAAMPAARSGVAVGRSGGDLAALPRDRAGHRA